MKNKNFSSDITVLHIGDVSSPVAISKTKDWKQFVWDKLEFVLVSSLVFVLSYLALNYQAIYQNIEYKFKKAAKSEMPKFEILNETTKASVLPTEPILPAERPMQVPMGSPISRGGLEQDGSAVVASALPKLNLPIYPPDTRIVIPRIFKNIPVIGVGNVNLIARDWDALEKDIQQALRSGVVHYPGTALPGEKGNVVITGHSSFYAWDPGRFKDVFGLLHEVKPQDKIYLFHNQKRYTYEIFDIRVVKPTEIDVLGQTNDERLTLITCTPLGTNLKRLVVTAKRVS